MARSIDLAPQPAVSGGIRALIHWSRSHKLVLVIVFVSIVIRLYGITLYSFNGDEYNTINEAHNLGLNWMSIPYYLILHALINLGTTETILRLPSVVFDTATVAVLYCLGDLLAGRRASIALGTLAATSPFLVYHAQEARFYSLFIFTTTLFIYMTARMIETKPTRFWKLGTLLAGIALLFSHFLGLLAIAAQATVVVTAADLRWLKWKRAAVVVLLFAATFVIPLLPLVQRAMWSFYQAFAHTTAVSEPLTIPMSAVNFVKAAIALFIFSFGYHVYPLWWLVVVPGMMLTAFFLVAGVVYLVRKTAWAMLPVSFGLALLGTYLILDPIAGRLASGISPRHVAFIWPVYMLMIAIGVSSLAPRVSYLLLGVLVVLNIASLYPRWAETWSYTGQINYRAAGAFASAHLEGKTIILNDGRSQEPVEVYFPSEVLHKNFWTYLQGEPLDDLLTYDRIIVVVNDYQATRRQDADRLLSRLTNGFTLSAGQVEYPLFEYVLDRKTPGVDGFAVDQTTGQVRQPVGMYGLEFQDLRLPAQVEVAGTSLTVSGAFSIPSSMNEREVGLPLSGAPSARRLVLLSNVTQAERLTLGQQLAEVDVETIDGFVHTIPLRFGVEVQDWSLNCMDQTACQTVYQWHKRVAFVGQQSYPGAWRDFRAGIHATSLALPSDTNIARLTFRYTHSSGRLYIWGIAAVP